MTVLISALSVAAVAQGQMFQDVTGAAGFDKSGERWGASWGDINGDGWLELFVNNHRERNSLYRNNGDGTFTDIVLQVDGSGVWTVNATAPYGDTHGASWADADNDGDLDLLVAVSNTAPTGNAQFMVNQGGFFVDQALSANLAVDDSARQPFWFDYDGDGALDVAHMNSNDIILKRRNTGAPGLVFDTIDTSAVGLFCNGNHGGLLSDVDNNGAMDFICVPRGGTFPQKVYDFTSTPGQFTDITSTVPSVSTVSDAAIGDFDNNLQPDFFLLRGRTRRSEVVQIDANRLEGWLSTGNFSTIGFDFVSNGSLNVDIDMDFDESSRIFVGSAGTNPSAIPFALDSNNPAHQGLSPSTDHGTYIGFNTQTQRWEVELRADEGARRAYVVIESSAVSSGLNISGQQTIDLPMTASLMMNLSGGYQEQSAGRGFSEALACNSAAIADFDNDMDEDIFLACTTGLNNLPDRLYVNDGSGNFTLANAFGAEGVTGVGLQSGAGAADSVATADYDNDGFMDLFVTNGVLLQPVGFGGPDKLFRNLGNGNNWIKLSLAGSGSGGTNASGIGAKVLLTAGGVTQLRQQNGQIHRWSQNSPVLHFGLAGNTQASTIIVEWPSGVTDTFTNVAANNSYVINEGGSLVMANPGAPIGSPIPQPGDECGSPEYDRRQDRDVYVWKDCTTGEWFVRVSAGGDPQKSSYTGLVFAEQGFGTVTPYSFEGADFANDNGQTLDFGLTVSNNGDDGFQFFLNDPGGPDNCLSVNAPLFVGHNALPASSSLNLSTLQTCSALTIAIDDVTVGENQGAATFTVSLSEAPGQAFTVDYTTVAQTSGGGTVVVFEDDFETDKGWTTNPSGTDTATTGHWERANPQSTSSGGSAQQLGNTFSGSFDLVTDGNGGSSVGSFDIDNGVTSVRSPDIALPATGPIDLSFAYYMAHLSNSSTADFLRVKVVGSTTQTVFEELGSGNTDAASWQTFVANLDAFAGQTVHLLVEAADNSNGSLVEAALDDVLITGPGASTEGFAIADVDYTTVSGVLNFGATDLSQTIVVPVALDSEEEGPETFLVQLSNASLGTISDDTGVGTIDDPGAVGSAILGDFVWDDLNANGIQDSGEPGLGGVTVELEDCAGNLFATTVTDGGGIYRFEALPAGGYKVRFVVLPGYAFSPPGQGSGGKDSNADPGTGLTGCVAMADSQTRLGIDAGMTTQGPQPSARIGDYVWDDADGNGIQDSGELGMSGVTVNLLDCSGGLSGSTTTGAAGDYVFSSLAAGSYVVEFVAPAGFSFSPTGQGAGGKDSDADQVTGRSRCLPMADGQTRFGIDAGLTTQAPQPTGRIGDFVWEDLDEDGVQDAGEPGFAGVTVNLLDCSGNNQATTATDGDGKYLFSGLSAGNYMIQFVAPSGFTFSPEEQGAGGLDSNADPATGLSRCLSMTDSQVRFGIDAGLR